MTAPRDFFETFGLVKIFSTKVAKHEFQFVIARRPQADEAIYKFRDCFAPAGARRYESAAVNDFFISE